MPRLGSLVPSLEPTVLFPDLLLTHEYYVYVSCPSFCCILLKYRHIVKIKISLKLPSIYTTAQTHADPYLARARIECDIQYV